MMEVLGLVFGALGIIFGALGLIFGALGLTFGALGTIWGALGTIWGALGLIWGPEVTSLNDNHGFLAILDSFWAPFWSHVGVILVIKR